MSTVNNPNSNEFKLQNLAEPVNTNKKNDDNEAVLAHLSLLIEEVLEAITPSADKAAGSKIVRPDFNAGASSANGPTNSQMQDAYSTLIGLLAELQGDIAINSNKIANFDSKIGKALMQEMQTQFNETIKKLDDMATEREHASFWSKLAEWVEGIVAGLALLMGQPELAAVMLTFLTLSASGGMDKITKGIADLISNALVRDGVPKDEADKIAKILSDILVVAAAIAVTVVTCGAGAVGAAANTAKYAILTGSMAFGSTGLGNDIATEVCNKMTDGKTKETLTLVIGLILNIAATITGAGAGIALAAGSEAELELNSFLKSIVAKLRTMLESEKFTLSAALRTLMAAQITGAAVQFSGQVATGAVKVDLANTTNAQGLIQAFLAELQALIRMNSGGSSANAKDLGSKMRTLGSEIAVLATEVNAAQRAVAQVLQA